MEDPILVIALGAVVAGFVQGLSGFAFGLVAMSIWAWSVEPRLAAVLAVFGGLGGFTGAIPTLWCTLRGFDKDAQRAVIQNFNLTMLAVTFASYLAGGLVTRSMLPMFALVAPAVLLPVLLGARVYVGLSEVAFRRVVLVLLTLAGVALLAAALPVLWRRSS